MERPRWSNDEWPRVVEAVERALDAYQRAEVMVALGMVESAGESET